MDLKNLALTLARAYMESNNNSYTPTLSGFYELLQRGYDPALMLEDVDSPHTFNNGKTLASILEPINGIDDDEIGLGSKLFDVASIGDTFTGLNIQGAPNAPLGVRLKTLFNRLKKNPTQYIYNGHVLK